MATVEEVLKSTGFTDEQISALDAKAKEAFGKVLTTAEQEREKAELAQRSVRKTYDEEINPALVQWANEKTALETKMAAYQTALKNAKEGGFNVPDILTEPATPGSPTKDPATGKFVASGTSAAVDPKIADNLRTELGTAFAFAADTSWKYRQLYGTEMPDAPTTIIREATAQRMSPAEYAAKKYDFAGKEKAKREAEQKAHDDAIRKEVAEAKDKEWAEKTTNGSPVRQAQESSFSEVRKAVKEGTRPDPLKMTPAERANATRQNIRKDIAAQESGTVQ